MPLKYVSNFWKSFEMLLINCQVKLKMKWTKCFVLSANGNGNNDASSNNYYQRLKVTCSCSQSISKRQTKTIENSK